MNIAFLRDDCDVAVIGAGPYGLAVAAHLRGAKVPTRVFGESMETWRANMPKGMRLRSPWRASHIADPGGRFTLDAFAVQHAIPHQDELPLEHFQRYGEWFQQQTVPDLDRRKVVRVEDAGRGFCLVLEDGEARYAQRVVVATGLGGQGHRPAQFEGLPAALVSHSSEHASFDKWRGKRVAVIGRGQSACESAVLLREAGNETDLICRGDVRWLGTPVGLLPLDWLNELPGVVHHVPAGLRSLLSGRTSRATAADWLRPRMVGVRVYAGRKIMNVRVMGSQVGLQLDDGLRIYDQVVLGTGYQVDIAKSGILSPTLLRRVACSQCMPSLGTAFESTVPGLYFVGASAARSYGPLMNFVAGAGYAARSVTRAVLARRRAQADEIAAMRRQLETSSAENALL